MQWTNVSSAASIPLLIGAEEKCKHRDGDCSTTATLQKTARSISSCATNSDKAYQLSCDCGNGFGFVRRAAHQHG